MCTQLKVSAVNVDYRLCPENPFPTSLNDAFDSIQWAHQHAAELKADPTTKGFIVGGISAGANLAAVTANRFRDQPELGVRLTGLILSVLPCLSMMAIPHYPDGDKLIQSYEQNKDAPVLSVDAVKRFAGKFRNAILSV